MSEFEHVTLAAGHGWHYLNLSSWFGRWIAQHEFFDALVNQPRELRPRMVPRAALAAEL